eukprot:6020265-Alexandrium_andersonii.AAC.1
MRRGCAHRRAVRRRHRRGPTQRRRHRGAERPAAEEEVGVARLEEVDSMPSLFPVGLETRDSFGLLRLPGGAWLALAPRITRARRAGKTNRSGKELARRARE